MTSNDGRREGAGNDVTDREAGPGTVVTEASTGTGGFQRSTGTIPDTGTERTDGTLEMYGGDPTASDGKTEEVTGCAKEDEDNNEPTVATPETFGAFEVKCEDEITGSVVPREIVRGDVNAVTSLA